MIDAWWFAVASLGWLVILVWVQRTAYRHGIWDGAFNHFLPIVQREMRFYDARRAEIILSQEFPE